MHLCGWSHLVQDFFPFSANRTTANKQEAPCTQLRARECGEGVVYRPPNNIIPLSHPHPLAAYPGKSKVCANSANQGPWDESQGQPAPPGVEATANTARASCLSCGGPAAPHPPPEPNFQRLDLLPSPSRGSGGLISTCFILEDGVWSTCQGKALREIRSPREPVENCFSNLVVYRFIYAQICTLQPRERERDKDRVRERERIFPGGKEELIKKREVQDHAFTLKSLFTSKPTFLTLQPLIYICLLSNWVLPTTREQKGSFYFLPPPFKTSIKMFSVQVEWHKRWLKC